MRYILILLVLFSTSASAQSFFKAQKKPSQQMMAKFGAAATITQNVIRPVVNVASYSIPDNNGLTGGGISFQHQEYSAAQDRWTVIWSLNALAWYSTANKTYYGVAAGALNNLLLIGLATSDGKHYIGTVGVGINFNN